MKSLFLALSLSLSFVTLTSSFAADLHPRSRPRPSQHPIPIAEQIHPSFSVVDLDSWNSGYVGTDGIYKNQAGTEMYGVGVNAGVNSHQGIFLIGGEAAYEEYQTFSKNYVQGLGKVGVVVSDKFAVYALAGLDSEITHWTDSHYLLGAGAEYNLLSNVSVRANYLHGYSLNNSVPEDKVSVGMHLAF
jgi:outer membrane immunogenic protein